jgi:MFS family permease
MNAGKSGQGRDDRAFLRIEDNELVGIHMRDVEAVILIRFCERIPYAFIILWAINLNGISAQQYGVLTAIEMVAAMLCYIPVAYLADKHGQQPFILATFIFFTLFPVSLLFAHGFASLALAFAVRGLKEFGEPARKALIIAYAPPALESRAYGVYYLIRDCIVTTGSFAGAALWNYSPQANFLGAPSAAWQERPGSISTFFASLADELSSAARSEAVRRLPPPSARRGGHRGPDARRESVASVP